MVVDVFSFAFCFLSVKEIWAPVWVVDKGQLKADKNQSGNGGIEKWFLEQMSNKNQRTRDRESILRKEKW